MLRSQILALFLLITYTSALVIPAPNPDSNTPPALVGLANTEIIDPDASPLEKAVTNPNSSSDDDNTVSPPPRQSDDDGEGYIPDPIAPSEYEDDGASGDSDGITNMSIGAQVGLIIGVVVAGLAILVALCVFWVKKKKEWAAALKRRTLNARRSVMGRVQSRRNTMSAPKTPFPKGVEALEKEQDDAAAAAGNGRSWWKFGRK